MPNPDFLRISFDSFRIHPASRRKTPGVASSPSSPGAAPADQTNVKRYRELADAGFHHNYSGIQPRRPHKMLQVARGQEWSRPQHTRARTDPETTAP